MSALTRVQRVVLALAVLLVAVNLRPAVVAVSPLVAEIRADLGLASATAGLLTTLPVLCFGLFAPVAPRLARRIGPEPTLLVALGVLAAGVLLRLVPLTTALFLGSLLAGAAIAVGNVLMPVVVRRDFPRRAGAMMGAVSVLISGGGALAAAATVPLEGATGLTWRPTLALWVLPALLALVLWWPAARGSHRVHRADPPPGQGAGPGAGLVAAVPRLRRDPLAWQVTMFMGMQSLQFYALTAWAPTVFVDAGHDPTTAGLLLSVAGVSSLFTAAVVPALAGRLRGQHALVLALLALWTSGYTGLLLAPEGAAAVLWMVLVGLGQGIGISLALTLMSLRSADAETTSRLSGMAQGVGYAVAAVGPLGLGALHDLTDGWTVPLLALVVLLVPLTVAGLGAARDRVVAPDVAPAAVSGARRPGTPSP